MRNVQSRAWMTGMLLLAIYLSSSSVALAQFECQPVAGGSTTNSTLTAADPQQTGRIIRDGRPSSCVGKTNGLQNSIPVRAKSFNFTNPTGQSACVIVDFDHTGCGGVNNTTANVAYSTYSTASPAANVIGDSGFSSTGKGSYSFSVAAGASYTIVVHEVTAGLGCAAFNFTINYSTSCRQAGFDSNNDGTAELVLFRPSTGQWFNYSTAGALNSTNTFGVSSDAPMTGDYTGDGNTDLAVYRTINNTYYSANAPGNPVSNFSVTPWGVAGDQPVPGDYDRDGKIDAAIYRASNGSWYVLNSSNNTLTVVAWGNATDTPYTGDFDGDRVNDFGVKRVISGNAYHLILESNFQQGFLLQIPFGVSGDRITIGDYDGDGKSDLAVFRPSNGTWYINQSSVTVGSPLRTMAFGQSGDIPQPADYDNDKKTDISVYRPSTGAWYIFRSSDSTVNIQSLGVPLDLPVTAPYVPPTM